MTTPPGRAMYARLPANPAREQVFASWLDITAKLTMAVYSSLDPEARRLVARHMEAGTGHMTLVACLGLETPQIEVVLQAPTGHVIAGLAVLHPGAPGPVN